ncbi:MAG TPA: YggS family pyridoxal phosphate-dependent enzyme, partial [Candidatus Limnocylindria bacterium]|nr:YggS family pyridoxal phosphate-dependent enzyme [Candidatus Limnocylindria bacterium]
MSGGQTITSAQLADRVAEVRARIALAARAAGRVPSGIVLCAACKAQDSETIRLSAALEIDVFGENRVQEMAEHLRAGAYAGKPCHFIGKLQTNKVRHIVGAASLIQSVDSPRLAAAIEAEAGKRGVVQDVLLEVNLGGEASKAGATPEDLRMLADAAAACPPVRVRGLMAIPPAGGSPDEAKRYFARLRGLLEELRQWFPEYSMLDTLSMGMSEDY